MRATDGLTEKFHGAEEPRQLPVTFDQEVARGRDDVVLAHLNHPLVSMSTRLLRAAVSDDSIGLHRVTAVVSDDPAVEDVLVGAYTRLVVVGADGVRLHEEVLHAGGWAPENGRFRRLENLSELGRMLEHALTHGSPASDPVWRRVVDRWPRVSDGLLNAIDWRTNNLLDQLGRRLAQREEGERSRITKVIDQFSAELRAKLDEGNQEGQLFGVEELKSDDERAQYRRDRQMWSERLANLADERDRELEAITARYRQQEPHRFPVAVVFVIPKREAIR